MVYDLTMNIWRRNGRLMGAGRLCQREIAHQVYCEPLPLFRASTVGLPSRSARFITSSSSTSRTPWASKALPAGSEDVLYLFFYRQFLPQFILVSRCRARDEKFLSLKTRSQASSAIAANSVSSLPQQRLDPSRGGQMIAPILSRKRDNREQSFFPQKKGSQWAQWLSIPSRTERACSSPKHITHRSCVSSSVRQRWHGSTHPRKRFSTDIFLLTLQKQGPLKEKRGWCAPQVPFYAHRCSLAYVIGVHLPMSSALGVCNHASGNRSHWRRSQSDPRKRTQCRVPFGRELPLGGKTRTRQRLGKPRLERTRQGKIHPGWNDDELAQDCKHKDKGSKWGG